MGEFIPSLKQERIFRELKETNNSIIISSAAGSGKTTTIIESLKYIDKHLEVGFFAFNKAIVDELKTRFPNKPKNITITTMHSFGSQVIYNHFGKLPLVENKTFKMALSMFKNWEAAGQIKETKWTYCDRVAQITNMMKLTLTEPNEQEVEELACKYGIMFIGYEIEHAIEVYKRTLGNLDTIDFNDMIFIPAIKNLKMKKFDVIFYDECQDANVASQRIVEKILKPTSRLIAVGDEMQAIYGFAGSDFHSFQKLKELMPNTVCLPLSVSYRCAKNIVKHAQKLVPSIEYSENAPDGVVRKGSFTEIASGDMVLCRNLKPLVLLLFDLVDRGVKANIKGREIGSNMINMIQKTKQTTTKNLIAHLKVDRAKLKQKLFKKGNFRPDNHVLMRTITERIEIIKILERKAHTVKELTDLISSIFLDKDFEGVTLSTIHKAKGLESERAFILCKELMPSAYASTKEEMQQEKNLDYVARTRAKTSLIYIDDYEIDEKADINAKVEEDD